MNGAQGRSERIARLKKIGDVDAKVLAQIQPHVVRRYRVMPLELLRDGRLRVAMTEPLDIQTVDTLQYLLQTVVEPVFVSRRELERAIKTHYSAERCSKTTYWPRDTQVSEDGTITMHTSGVDEEGALWTGQLVVRLEDEDYEFWRWVTTRWWKRTTIEKEQLEEVREEFKQFKRQLGS